MGRKAQGEVPHVCSQTTLLHSPVSAPALLWLIRPLQVDKEIRNFLSLKRHLPNIQLSFSPFTETPPEIFEFDGERGKPTISFKPNNIQFNPLYPKVAFLVGGLQDERGDAKELGLGSAPVCLCPLG